MLPRLSGQTDIAPQRPLPVTDKGSSAKIQSITGETVQFNYLVGSSLGIDAGEAAGTAVVGKLVYNNIKDKIGTAQATKANTSLAFSVGAFVTEVDKPDLLEAIDGLSWKGKLTVIAQELAQGEYIVDYTNGAIYGVKANDDTTLVNVQYVASAGAASSADVNLAKVGGLTFSLTDTKDGTAIPGAPVNLPTDSVMYAFDGSLIRMVRAGITAIGSTFTGFLNSLPFGIYNAAPTTRTEGQGGPIQTNDKGSVNSDLAQVGGSNITLEEDSDAVAQVGVPKSIPTNAYLLAYNNSNAFNLLRQGIVGVVSSFLGYLNTLPFAVFHTTPTVRTNGEGGPLEADLNGNTLVSLGTTLYPEDKTNGVFAMVTKFLSGNIYAINVTASTALEATHVIKAAPGNLIEVHGRIDSTAPTGTYYILLSNTTAAPSGAQTYVIAPFKIQHVNGVDDKFDMDYTTKGGIYHSTGIAIGLSTVDFTGTFTSGGNYMSMTAFSK